MYVTESRRQMSGPDAASLRWLLGQTLESFYAELLYSCTAN